MTEKLNNPYVHFNDIEVTDISPDEPITEEQKRLNQEFIDKIFKTCMSYVDPCKCEAGLAFVRRCQNRMVCGIVGADGHRQLDVSPDQELIDNFKFFVITHTREHVGIDAPLIVRECKTCHRLEFFGSGNCISTLLAIADVNAMNSGEISISGDDMIDEQDLIQALKDGGLDGAELVDLEEQPSESD